LKFDKLGKTSSWVKDLTVEHISLFVFETNVSFWMALSRKVYENSPASRQSGVFGREAPENWRQAYMFKDVSAQCHPQLFCFQNEKFGSVHRLVFVEKTTFLSRFVSFVFQTPRGCHS